MIRSSRNGSRKCSRQNKLLLYGAVIIVLSGLILGGILAGSAIPALDDDDGFFIREANINDVIQFIAKSHNLSYWQNPQLKGSKYEITGHLHSTSPTLEIIEELALIHNLTVLTIDGTLYVFTRQQFYSHIRNTQTK